jgi:protein-S-isoprenylcysteine O-methyltransferase Ste14
VSSPLYRYVRNPSYLGMLVGSIGWALAFRAVLGIRAIFGIAQMLGTQAVSTSASGRLTVHASA